MNHLKQVAWNASIEKRIAELEDGLKSSRMGLLDLIRRQIELSECIEDLKAKRGPGRPKVERDTAGNDRKV
jgi:hypothetical protein